MNFDAAHFDRLFRQDADPWGFRTRWYEQRKRDMLMSALPNARYAHALEPACANGELTVLLAARCDRVLALEGAPAAVELARQRVRQLPHVEVAQAWLPAQWPEGHTFDLIVLSEFLYYLPEADVTRLLDRARGALAPAGHLVTCHWRHPIEGCALDGNEVEARADESLCRLRKPVSVVDADFRLGVWSGA